MGITGLWEILDEGEVLPIAEYAARHYKQHRRPLRIAVDEAGWRFNNLNPFQVEQIRQQEAAANPIEKNIFWRILKLAKLNIQLIFVFDGAKRPWKRGRSGGNKLDYDRIKLLCQLLDHLGIAHHRAPGEAEAECARMQHIGVVDAVWSDDGDNFMFGARTLIRTHKAHGKPVEGYVRIYHMDTIQQQYDLDQQSFILFALLSGGDYDEKGLPGCGPKKAAQIAKVSRGLAAHIPDAKSPHFPAWRQALQIAAGIAVPFNYPNQRALGHYQKPKISTDEQLRNLNALKRGWFKQINQVKLRDLLRARFNIQTPAYIKHLAPLFLIRALTQTTNEEVRADNLKYEVQLKPVRRNAKSSDAEDPPLLTKISFNPVPAIEFDLAEAPVYEDWSEFAKDGRPYDPRARVDCEILPDLLSAGLPDGGFVAPEPARTVKRQRAKQDIEVEQTVVPKRPRYETDKRLSQSSAASESATPSITASSKTLVKTYESTKPPVQRAKFRLPRVVMLPPLEDTQSLQPSLWQQSERDNIIVLSP